MRLVYFSNPFFADADFSLLRELRCKVDLFYFINLSPYSLNSNAINFTKINAKSGIFTARSFKEMEPFNRFVDLDRTFIVNRTSNKGYNISNLILSIKLFWKLFKLNSDIIHVTFFYKYQDFLLYFFRKKTLLTVHDPFPHSGEVSLERKLYSKISYKLLSNFIILNSNQKKNFIDTFKLQKKNVFVNSLGIYDYLLMYVNQNSIKYVTSKSYILFFGRISPYKGIENLMKAMSDLEDKFPETKLIVAGNGKYYFDVEKYKEKSNIEIRNRYIPNEELAALVENSLFVVCPYTDATQSGVIMTSFAFQKPVIATNVGGLSEYVEHLETGVLISPQNVDELKNWISILLSDIGMRSKMSHMIKLKYFDGDDSWNSISNRFIKIIKSVKIGK
jgi:glycosyltransferase involved in cell wall biosynthesis